jgi:uncharacterized integral membrane protein
MSEHMQAQPRRRPSAKAIVAVVVAVLFLVFVLQNTDETQVSYLGFDVSTGTWLVLVVAFGLGMLVGWLLSRRRGRDD